MTALFPVEAGAMPVPLSAQIACVEREIGMRLRVYPHRVADGKMAQTKADSEIAAMRAVLETLRGVKSQSEA